MVTGNSGEMWIGGYAVGSLLGHGGMGSVYRATVMADRAALGLKQGDEVALKILHAHLATIPEFNRRFLREARVATKLQHPHVARVLEEGVSDDGRPYLVMELARGRKLGELLADGKPLPAERIFSVMRQVAEVLDAAHKVELVHRDIKPDNLVLDDAGNVKVLDFGLVKDAETVSMVSQAISMTGKAIGTPAYMSPEQCRGGHEVDHRSDLYSLGVTAYQMATGRAPFTGPTPTAFIHQHETEIPPAIEKLNPAIPKPLIAVIYRLMAKKPADRYPTAAELLADLEPAEAGRMPEKIYRFRKQRHLSARRAVALAAAAVVVALAGAGAWYYSTTDAARTELQQAQTLARQAAESGNPSRAVNILSEAISKHARRRELLPPLEKLRDELSSQAAAQEKAQLEKRTEEEKQRQQQTQRDYDKLFQQGVAALKEKRYADALQAFQLAQAKRPTEEVRQQIAEVRARQTREQLAAAALAEARAAFARNDLAKARDLAGQGLKDYPDSEAAKAFAELRVEAEGKLAAEAEAAQAAMKQAHDRLVQQALSALKERRYADALQAFELAQGKLADPQIKAQIETLKARIEMEKGAVALLAEARAAFARNDLAQAAALAARGVKDFGGSDEANDFASLRVEAEQKQAATMAQKQARARQLEQQGDEAHKAGQLRDALTAWQSAAALVGGGALDQKIAATADAVRRYDAALAAGRQLLDAGRAGKDKSKCLEAARRFEEARRAWATAEAAALAAEAQQTAAAIKEALAVVDFQVQGEVGIADAGKIVARLLLSEFAEKFELVTRTQLETVLKEKNLQFTDLMTPDKALEHAKLLPVRYLVVGEVMKGAEFWLTAQMVEIGPGIIRNPRKISAASYRALEAQVATLAKLLEMNDEAYRKWQHDKRAEQFAPVAGKTMLVDLGRGAAIEMVGIPPGEFMMGSSAAEREWAAGTKGQGKPEWFTDEGEHPRRTTIREGFWLGRTELTVGQWRRFVEQTGYQTEAEKRGEAFAWDWDGEKWGVVKGASWRDPNYGFRVQDNHPVACVSWNDAMAFCQWLTKKEREAGRLAEGCEYRLPTEAEWEYACRGGRQGTRFWWGDSVADGKGRLNAASDDELGHKLPDDTWSAKFPWSDGFAWVSPADSYGDRGRNGFGLADMLGNVWEWCLDGYDAAGAHQEPYTADTTRRVVGGASFSYRPGNARCADRDWNNPDNAGSSNGFRVCCGVSR